MDWIPAFTGITGVSFGLIFQMAPLASWGTGLGWQLTWTFIRCMKQTGEVFGLID